MSIKHVHIIFIIFSTLLSVLLTVLFFGNYQNTELAIWMLLGLMALVASVALPVYGVAFYKKMKKLEIYK
ncbi:MAG: hypothetical protein AAF571_04075 [Verrucomicrobiota bacterium]